MAPRRGRSRRVVDSPPPDSPPPPESEDAKPDVQQLDANLEADQTGPSNNTHDAPASDQTLPSDPLQPPMPHGLPIVPTPDPTTDPSPAIASPSSTPRGRGRGRGQAARAQAQPRGVRRSAAQRAELAIAADERDKVDAAARAKDAAKAARGRGRGRGDVGARGGRGRGGFMGQKDRGEQEAVVSGPFSGGQVHKDARHIKRGAPSSGWTGLGSNAGSNESERPGSRRAWSHMGQKGTSSGSSSGGTLVVKAEPGSSSDAKPVLDRDGDMRMNYVDGGYISSDEEGDAEKAIERVNIEDFGVIDLTQQDEAEAGYYAPVRVMRVDRKDRAPGINAEGATNQDGEVAVDANDSVAEPPTTAGKKGKQKAAAEIQPTQDHQFFQAVYSDSDETQSEPQVKPDPEPVETATAGVNEDGPSSPETRRKGKERFKAARASSPALAAPGAEYQTREDLQEWERTQNDLRVMRSELGDPVDRDDTAMEGAAATADSRADKVYLFQFPPILPDLLPTSAANTSADPDAMALDPAPPTTDANPPIKLEPTISNDASSTSPSFPSGAVGKLRVRASGRVELDWGGTAMGMGLGTEAGFLQDLMLVALPEGKAEVDAGRQAESERGRGEAVSMGRVRGKFVVVPDWGELLS